MDKPHRVPCDRLSFLSRLALPLLCATLASAEELPPSAAGEPVDPVTILNDLETYIVTASLRDETWLETPYLAERLSDAMMVDRGVRSVPEAFEQNPSVLVQKTSQGQGSPCIRGFTGYHTLFLIDGVRLNHAAFRAGPNQYWNTVDVQGLSALEMVLSQGSVIYGSEAVGGTVQAFTHRPYYADEGFLSGGRSYSRYATGEDSFLQRGEVSFSEAGKYGLILGGTFKDFGDIRAAGLGRLPKTGYDEWDADGKLELFPNEDTRLTLFHHQVHIDDAWRTHSTVYSKSFAGTAAGDERARILDQSRVLSYLQLDGLAANPFFDRYTLNLSHQQHDEEQYRQRSNGRSDVQGFTLDSYGAFANFGRELPFTHLLYGASYYQDQVDSFRADYNADGSFRSRSIQGPVGDDGDYHLASAYFNTSSPLGDRLVVDLGARYTHAETQIDRVQDPDTGERIALQDSWDNLAGSGRLSFKLDEDGQFRLYGGVSQAFRAPNFSDLSRLDANRSNEIETPAPGLDPEEFLTFDAGVKAQAGPFEGSLSYYYTRVNDLILRAPTGRVVDGLLEVTKANIGDGHVQGVELAGSYQIDDAWRLFGGFAYQDSLVSTFPTSNPVLEDEVLSRILPTNGYAGLRWDPKDGQYWIEGLVSAVTDAGRLSSSDVRDTQRIPPGGTPGYWLATLRAGCWIRDQFLVTAAAENLFDEAYRIHGSGQNEPGINFVIGAEVRF